MHPFTRTKKLKSNRRHDERDLHKSCIQLLRHAAPPNCVFFHIPSGEYRRKATAALLQAMGVVPGLPDLVLIYKARILGIELKSTKGRLNPAQKNMHECLRAAGCLVTVVRNIEEFITVVNSFMPFRVSTGTRPPQRGHNPRAHSATPHHTTERTHDENLTDVPE